MKKLLFYIFLSGIIFSCQPKDKTTTGTGNNKVNQPGDWNQKEYPHPHQYYPKGIGLGAKPKPAEAPNLNTRMTHVIDKYWWYDGYVSSRETVRQARKGHWYYYYADGTFMYGKYDKELAYGTWRMVETLDGKEILYNRSDDGTETMQWETMMSHTNDKMVWMGPAIGPNKGDQGMLQPYLQVPTPKDLNWAMPKIERAVSEDDPINQ